MSRIIPLQAKITLQQIPDTTGNFYPACVFSNETFISMFENSLLMAKGLLDTAAIEFATVESVLTGLSEYRVWKANKEKKETPPPTEIVEHFALLPEGECNLEMPFQPFNNVPTEVIMYSHGEVLDIVGAMKMALEKADAEQTDTILPIFDSFNAFLTDWELNQQATGSYYANEQKI